MFVELDGGDRPIENHLIEDDLAAQQMPHRNIKRQSLRGEASAIVPDRDAFRLHVADKRAP